MEPETQFQTAQPETKVEEPTVTAKKRDYLLPGSILIAALLISGAVVYSAGKKSSASPTPQANLGDVVQPTTGIADIDLSGAIFLGDPKAPVTLVEYSDFQCPFCGRFFSETLPLIKKEYIDTGRVRMVYKDFAFLGPESIVAAEASRCAAEQGKFWEYHDLIFATEIADGREHNGNLNPTTLKSLANQIGLESGAFGSCVDSRKYQAEVSASVQDARAVGVRATPTVFIDGRKLEGALPYGAFQAAIEEALVNN